MTQNNQVITFGCRLNIYESEIIKQNLTLSGLRNTVVFNTCTVTKVAEKEAIRAIKKLKKEQPHLDILVTGCAAQTNPDKFSKLTEVTKILGNEEKLLAHNYLPKRERVIVNDIMAIKETSPHLVSSFSEHSRAFLQIQNGCNHRCTFCIIPYGRGNSRSVPLGAITEQVRAMVKNGYNEVVLTGVDVTSYGPDLPGTPTFAHMIRRLLGLVPELKRLRLASIDVAEIDDELFDLMAYEPRLMPHFHISLQSGDNMILKRMQRRHQRQDVINFCSRLRSKRPDVAFGADMIAGFPTETEEMFLNSLRLIEEANLQYLHVFPYSIREGTPAARMPQVAEPIKKERAKLLRDEGKKSQDRFFRAFDGTIANLLVEKNNIARSENFIPVKIKNSNEVGEIISGKLKYVNMDMELDRL